MIESALRKRQPTRPRHRRLLREQDFTYLGYYDIPDNLWTTGFAYGQGLTHYYVSGQLRFISCCYDTGVSPRYRVGEFTLPASFGGTVVAGTTWADIWNGQPSSSTPFTGSGQDHLSFWWEEEQSRLWTATVLDYPQGGYSNAATASYSVRDLNSNGTISNFKGFFGFEGIGDRCNNGGLRRVPTWFKNQYSVGPYIGGHGAYNSLMGQGLGASLGPMFIFPGSDFSGATGLPYGSTSNSVASASIKIGADHRSGATNTLDWFSDFNGRTFDRGVRKTLTVANWFDGNDTRSNPSTLPTYPTDLAADPQWWYGPTGGSAPGDPDNYCRWCWGDSYHDTFCWIDNDAGSRAAHGMFAVASLCNEIACYISSALTCQSRVCEGHVFDPAHVGECVIGNRAVYNVRPTNLFQLSPGGTSFRGDPGYPWGAIDGATFDQTTNRLYLCHRQRSGAPTESRLFVYYVDGG